MGLGNLTGSTPAGTFVRQQILSHREWKGVAGGSGFMPARGEENFFPLLLISHLEVPPPK